MAKSRRKAMATKVKDEPMSPTPEQMARGRYEVGDVLDKQANGRTLVIGKALRRRPMVSILAEKGYFTDREFKVLDLYRHSADTVARSPIPDSLNRERFGGHGDGPSAAYITALGIVEECEKAAGSLAGILRAIIVDEKSLNEWTIDRYGGVERCRQRGTKEVCVIEPRAAHLAMARFEIKLAARRVEEEVGS
jgi:hypothetical protein